MINTLLQLNDTSTWPKNPSGEPFWHPSSGTWTVPVNITTTTHRPFTTELLFREIAKQHSPCKPTVVSYSKYMRDLARRLRLPSNMTLAIASQRSEKGMAPLPLNKVASTLTSIPLYGTCFLFIEESIMGNIRICLGFTDPISMTRTLSNYIGSKLR